MLRITDQISIEDWELTEQFVRASGPGGQNVNKTSSAVELRFEAERSPNLPDPVKRRLKRIAGRRWTADGAVVIFVQETRHQSRNREIARERLAGFKTPKAVVFDELPKTSTGKIQKFQLRAIAKQMTG